MTSPAPSPAGYHQPSPAAPTRFAHDISLDALRIVATLMVLLIHISGKGFAGIHESHWWAINIWESVSRVCVPLFFMITGALLLPRDHNVSSVLKRAWRILYVLVAWSLIFFIYLSIRQAVAPPSTWLGAIARGPVIGHFWYLYSLLAAYFVTPILAAFYRNTALRMQIMVLLIWLFAASVIPFINRFLNSGWLGFDTQFFYIYPAYMLAGALLYKHMHMNSIRAALGMLIWAAATGATAFCTWYYSKDVAVNTELYYEYFAPLVVIAAFALFCSLRWISNSLSNRWPMIDRWLVFFGSLSFGVYLIHPAVIWEFERRGYDWHFINPWFAVPALLAGVSVVSGAITWLIRRLKPVRWLIPG